MEKKDILFIERFGMGIVLDETYTPSESNKINLICESESYEDGLILIEENKDAFSIVSIKAFTTCAVELWQKEISVEYAYLTSKWAFKIAELLCNQEALISIILIQIGILVEVNEFDEAKSLATKGQNLCQNNDKFTHYLINLEEALEIIASKEKELYLEVDGECAICNRTFRVYDGGLHVVFSLKPHTLAKVAHCFSCNLIICFSCAEWEQAQNYGNNKITNSELQKALNTPHCPFCKNPIGSPQITKPKFELPLTDLIYFEKEAILNSINGHFEKLFCDHIRELLFANDLSTYIKYTKENILSIDQEFFKALETFIGEAEDKSTNRYINLLYDSTKLIVQKQQTSKDLYVTPVFAKIRKPPERVTGNYVEQLLQLANSYKQKSDLSRAMQEAKKAEKFAIQIVDSVRLVRAQMVQGLIYLEVQRIPEAMNLFRDALILAEKQDLKLLSAKLHGNLAGCYAQGEYKDAQKNIMHSQLALNLYKEIGDELGIGRTLNNIGITYIQQEDFEQALLYLEDAYLSKKKSGVISDIANTINALSFTHESLGNLDRAYDLARQALKICERESSPIDTFPIRIQLANIATKLGDENLAIKTLVDFTELFHKTVSKISDSSLRNDLYNRFAYGYHQLAMHFLKQDKVFDALQTIEAIEAFSLLEYLSYPVFMKMSSEYPIGDFDFVAEFSLPGIDENVIFNRLKKSKSLLIKYSFINNDLYAFIAIPKATNLVWKAHKIENFGYSEFLNWFLTPPIDQSSMPKCWFAPLHNFRGSLKGDVYQFEVPKDVFVNIMIDELIQIWDEKLIELGNLIYEPISDIIETSNLEKILFVPVGLISQIPLHALWNSLKNQKSMIIDNYEVVYCPSLKIYQASGNYDRNSHKSILILSDAEDNLPMSHYESKMIANVFRESKELNGKLASYSNLADEINNYDIIHIATHAIYDPFTANKSGLCLALENEVETNQQMLYVDGSGNITNERKNAIYRFVPIIDLFKELHLKPGTVVFLSACDSGNTIMNSRGYRYESIASAFLANGANCVICSQWPVDSLASCVFSILFYRFLANFDIPTSLNRAQRKMREITCREISDLLNRTSSDFNQIDQEFIRSYFYKDYADSDKPFSSVFYWGCFSVWGAP
jgi:CHAT domain-containing protein/Flp pilus assembly protein TadD